MRMYIYIAKVEIAKTMLIIRSDKHSHGTRKQSKFRLNALHV